MKCYTARSSPCRKSATLPIVLQSCRRPIPQRNHFMCCRRAMNSRTNATHVLFEPWTDISTGKAIKKGLSIVTTTHNRESHHHKHLHLQSARLVPWITFCHSRDLFCSTLQSVPNSAVGCSTYFRPEPVSSASRVLSKARKVKRSKRNRQRVGRPPP